MIVAQLIDHLTTLPPHRQVYVSVLVDEDDEVGFAPVDDVIESDRVVPTPSGGTADRVVLLRGIEP